MFFFLYQTTEEFSIRIQKGLERIIVLPDLELANLRPSEILNDKNDTFNIQRRQK